MKSDEDRSFGFRRYPERPTVMKGRDRNSLCWCGSGIKYKKCHLNRDAQPKDNPWKAFGAIRKDFSKKKCCAEKIGLGACEGSIVKAHTVSKSANLTKIAEKGHVLHYKADISDMDKNGGKLTVAKVGTREASVFYGFCSKHDREIFSCIENEAFTGRPDQCLAIAYRSMSRELYGKDASSNLREVLRGADKGLSTFEQMAVQHVLETLHSGNEAARLELKSTHDKLTTALVDEQPEVLSSQLIRLEGPLPFSFAGAWSPFTDLYGNQLQDGESGALLDQVIVSSFAEDVSAQICISWIDKKDAPGQILSAQIEELPPELIASACLQLVVKHIENVFYSPSWFNGLSEKQRAQMDTLAASGMDFLGSVPAAKVDLDIDFRLPSASETA